MRLLIWVLESLRKLVVVLFWSLSSSEIIYLDERKTQ